MFLTKKVLNGLLTLCTVACSATAYSATTASPTENDEFYLPFLKPGHLVFQVGGYQGIQGEEQHINIEGLIGDTFTVNDVHDENALVGLGFFLDGPNLGRVQTSFGVNAFYLTPMSVSGDVIQENYFDNLSYHYNTENFPIYAMAKSIINLNSSKFALTLDAGIGPNFTRALNFKEDSLDGGITLPDKDIFSAHTATALSETVGIGIRINDVFGPIPLDVGYRFFYLGQGRFTTDNDQVLNTLNTGKMYANAIVFSISF